MRSEHSRRGILSYFLIIILLRKHCRDRRSLLWTILSPGLFHSLPPLRVAPSEIPITKTKTTLEIFIIISAKMLIYYGCLYNNTKIKINKYHICSEHKLVSNYLLYYIINDIYCMLYILYYKSIIL